MVCGLAFAVASVVRIYVDGCCNYLVRSNASLKPACTRNDSAAASKRASPTPPDGDARLYAAGLPADRRLLNTSTQPALVNAGAICAAPALERVIEWTLRL
jgi:hypothetical protein